MFTNWQNVDFFKRGSSWKFNTLSKLSNSLLLEDVGFVLINKIMI